MTKVMKLAIFVFYVVLTTFLSFTTLPSAKADDDESYYRGREEGYSQGYEDRRSEENND